MNQTNQSTRNAVEKVCIESEIQISYPYSSKYSLLISYAALQILLCILSELDRIS